MSLYVIYKEKMLLKHEKWQSEHNRNVTEENRKNGSSPKFTLLELDSFPTVKTAAYLQAPTHTIAK